MAGEQAAQKTPVTISAGQIIVAVTVVSFVIALAQIQLQAADAAADEIRAGREFANKSPAHKFVMENHLPCLIKRSRAPSPVPAVCAVQAIDTATTLSGPDFGAQVKAVIQGDWEKFFSKYPSYQPTDAGW